MWPWESGQIVHHKHKGVEGRQVPEKDIRLKNGYNRSSKPKSDIRQHLIQLLVSKIKNWVPESFLRSFIESLAEPELELGAVTTLVLVPWSPSEELTLVNNVSSNVFCRPPCNLICTWTDPSLIELNFSSPGYGSSRGVPLNNHWMPTVCCVV